MLIIRVEHIRAFKFQNRAPFSRIPRAFNIQGLIYYMTSVPIIGPIWVTTSRKTKIANTRRETNTTDESPLSLAVLTKPPKAMLPKGRSKCLVPSHGGLSLVGKQMAKYWASCHHPSVVVCVHCIECIGVSIGSTRTSAFAPNRPGERDNTHLFTPSISSSYCTGEKIVYPMQFVLNE